MKIVTFSFKNNISEKILRKIDFESRHYLSTSESIQKFVELLKINKPKFVLGLGMYSGRDQEKLRIETICKNKFRNRIIGKKEKYKLNNFISPTPSFKYGKNMGNSYCNLISYKIMEMVEREGLTIKYSFIHVPKEYYEKEAVKEIHFVVARSKATRQSRQ